MTHRRDFAKQKLQGRSFRNQNLVGANFSYADIRGANFKGANLTDASFHEVRAGSQFWAIGLVGVLAIFSCFIVGLFGIPIADTVNINYLTEHGPKDAIFTFLTILLLLAGLLRFRSLVRALLLNVLVILILWLSLVMVEFYLTGNIMRGLIDSDSLSIEAATLTTPFLAGSVMVMTLSIVTQASLRIKTNTRSFFSLIEGVALATVMAAAIPGTLALPGTLAKGSLIVISLFMGGVTFYVSQQIVKEPQGYPFLRSATLWLTTIGATCFRGANLARATFTCAQLNGIDFDNAQLVQTDFHAAYALDSVRARNTLLSQAKICKLLTTRYGQGESFVGCNLQGAFLPEANLSHADLTGANLSNANLTGADLSHSNLSRVEALGAHFNQSVLTGACLQSWNIDSATCLDNIHCEYIYLLTDHRERRPSSGRFQPGEFTKLFSDALHTVDLIFRNGLDLSAFVAAFKEAQSEHPETDLSIRSFENKGDGIVLVKVNVPEQANKAELHNLLTQQYNQALNALEARHQSELQARDQQITLYQQYQSDLKALTQLLTQPENRPSVGKRVTLKLGPGDPDVGLSVTLQVAHEGAIAHLEKVGQLPPYAQLVDDFGHWQQLYHQSCRQAVRLSTPAVQITNISYRDIFECCYSTATSLQRNINYWLNSDCFRPLKEQLLEQLQPDESIRFILQTDDPNIQRLPLHLWDWFARYPKAELSLSYASYNRIATTHPMTPLSSPQGSVNILCILGDSTGIDVQRDRELLEQLPGVNILLLTEPDRQQINNAMWDKAWDILFFAGHSARQPDKPGHLCINATDTLTLDDLRYSLRKALEHGLKLAIFNSCDGLGLIENLADIPLPTTIAMRSPVPDIIAQNFLKNFLLAFSSGLPLHLAVRDARERLQGLEHQYPFATWLPVIYQNPTATPYSWQNLRD